MSNTKYREVVKGTKVFTIVIERVDGKPINNKPKEYSKTKREG